MMLAAVLALACGGPPACTPEAPCDLAVAKWARERAAKERDQIARMADVPATEHNIRVTNQANDALRKLINIEREAFSDWCAVNHRVQDRVRAAGGELTSEQVFAVSGKPDADEYRAQGELELRVWSWTAAGPLSGVVIFGVSFTRPAGSQKPWAFFGCSWCASGSEVTTAGCTKVPFTP